MVYSLSSLRMRRRSSSLRRTAPRARVRLAAMPFPGLVSRVRAMDPWRLDLLIAAGLVVVFELELLLLTPADAAHRGLIAVVLAVEAATFALRRRAPLVPMTVTLGMLTALDTAHPIYVNS